MNDEWVTITNQFRLPLRTRLWWFWHLVIRHRTVKVEFKIKAVPESRVSINMDDIKLGSVK